MIALVALVQRELEWPKYWSQGLPLIADSSRGFESSSRRLCFLHKSQDDLYGKIGEKSKLLVFLSTNECGGQFWLLEQSQKSM